MRKTLERLFAVDPRSLGAFRIGLALMVLADLAGRARAIEAHYTGDGVLPAQALHAMKTVPILSLHLLSDAWAFQVAMFVLAGVFGVMNATRP